jgi:RHS repeat-associated protein
VRLLTDTSTNVTDTFTFDAYGTLIVRTGTNVNRFLYAGEQFDEDLGQYYLRARYLNPETGRFLTMDSHPGSNQDPLSLHKYLYAHNNPVNGIDPSGHSFILEFTISSAIRGSIAAFTAGSISAGYSYAKGATAGAALANGLKTAGIVGFSFVSPLAAVSLGAGGLMGVQDCRAVEECLLSGNLAERIMEQLMDAVGDGLFGGGDDP